MNYVIHASIAFFIYDLLYILRRIFVFYRHNRDRREDPDPDPDSNERQLKYKDELKKQLPFIAHHIAAVYILYSAINITNGGYILDAFLILEKSNIMIYVSFHIRKQYREYTQTNAISEFIQLITYTYYRLFVLSVFVYDLRNTLVTYPYITQLLILLVYLMGYAWSYRLLNKNIANYGMILCAAASRKYSSDG
jgi:hypothetical protein